MVNELDEDYFTTFYHEFDRPSYHPKLLLLALLLAYSQGIFSGRKIEKLMIKNLVMHYLTGQLVISYRTINRFCVANGMIEAIRNLFIDLNLQLKMEELVSLECLYIDALRLKLIPINMALFRRKLLLASLLNFKKRLQDAVVFPRPIQNPPKRIKSSLRV